LLFDRDPDAALPRVRRRLRRRAGDGLLLAQGQFQPGGSGDPGAARGRRRGGERSEGELKRARAAGIPPEKIIFSGVGKTARELALAVDEGIFCVNVESEAELALLSAIASEKRRTVNVSLRVNPDVDALTHEKIATGNAEDKFGIPIGSAREIYGVAAELPGINVAGVDVHIGSQITDLEPFESAFRMVADFVRELRTDGHAISHVDLGGGLGIPYLDDNDPPPDPDAYGALVKRAMHGLDCRLIFEPGRLIVGNAGILVTRVLYVKPGEAKNFVIVDAGMTELIRPTLYEAYHNIRPVMEPGHGARRMVADVVGPVCESGDFLALDRDLPEPKPGDLLAIMSAGAYGAVQGNTYNTRALAPEVLVRDAEWALVRPRVEVEKLIALDRLPPWL
jgi:diaminopimelate decarboxylase